MSPTAIVLLSIAAALLLLILVVVIRALRFNPEKYEISVPESVEFNAEKALLDLSEMVKCKTI